MGYIGPRDLQDLLERTGANIAISLPVCYFHRLQRQLHFGNRPLVDMGRRPTPLEFQTTHLLQGQPQTADDVEVIDEDVAVISADMFAKARNRARCNRQAVRAYESQDIYPSRTDSDGFKIRKITANRAMKPKGMNVAESSVQPREDKKFVCPICLGPLKEETTTTCGHIFCKDCIQAALAVALKCPTCRRKLRKNATHRIYLPKLEQGA